LEFILIWHILALIALKLGPSTLMQALVLQLLPISIMVNTVLAPLQHSMLYQQLELETLFSLVLIQ